MNKSLLKKFFSFLIVFTVATNGFVFAQREDRGINETEENLPPFEFIQPKEGSEIKGEIKIIGKVKDANLVEFYYQLPGAMIPIYLGKTQLQKENIWEYPWNTNLTPNGNYEIFAKISNQYGEYESSKIKVKVENEIPQDKSEQEKLKNEIEIMRKEVEKEEKEINEKKEEVKEKIIGGIEGALRNEINQNLEEFVEITKEEKKLQKEIEQKEEEKKETEMKIQSAQEELAKARKVKEKLPEGPKKEEVKVVEEIKKEGLEGQQKKKEETEKELSSLIRKSEELKKEKEKVKTEITKAVGEVTKPVDFLHELEERVKEKEEIKIEKSQILLKDRDGDGLSDEEETRLETNPFNPDSDGDGFLDGIEIKTGYNPLKAGSADKIIYQDPREVLPKKSDVYQVQKVEKTIFPTGGVGLKFSGKGLPNSFITLYIFSLPIIVAVKTNQDGYWEYTLDKPLADGEHRVYAALTSNQGQIEARSETFVFVKTGERIFRIFETPNEAVSPVESLRKPFIILISAIIILALGIAVITINLLTKKKIEKIKRV